MCYWHGRNINFELFLEFWPSGLLPLDGSHDFTLRPWFCMCDCRVRRNTYQTWCMKKPIRITEKLKWAVRHAIGKLVKSSPFPQDALAQHDHFLCSSSSFFPNHHGDHDFYRYQNKSDMTGQPAGLDLDENSDWLHTNDSYVWGTPWHEGTASTPTVLSQDRAAYGDSVLTNADSQDVPGAESVPNSSSASHNNKQCKQERERAKVCSDVSGREKCKKSEETWSASEKKGAA